MKLKADWLEQYSYETSSKILHHFATIHAEQAGPYADQILGLLRNRDYRRLLDLEISYGIPGLSVDHATHARQAIAFFSKWEDLKLDGDSKTLTAFRSFAKAELLCSAVNDRFCSYRTGVPMGYPYASILTDARSHCARILGRQPSLAALDMKFGPGATTNVKKKNACPRVKLGEPLECSHELEPFVERLMTELPHLALHHAESSTETPDGITVDYEVRVVPGRLQFVPKDAKKYRSIVVEPGLNTLFQQGIGRYIRKRLKIAGIDLDIQAEVNRKLAHKASLDDSLSTVDFSQASDSIAKAVVDFLLPPDWVYPSLARTSTVVYNGIAIKLEKFSSMGNSFTFELESMIFYTLACAACRYLGLSTAEVSIFGDDLVIPSEAYSLCELVFAFCGFTINPSKSYRSGPFRESCGVDIFKGFDIRPFYQKEAISGRTLFTLHNFYIRRGRDSMAAEVLKYIHPSHQIYGPDGYGDGHLLGCWTPYQKRIRLSGPSRFVRAKKFTPHELGWEGGFFDTFKQDSIFNMVPHSGDVLLPVYSVYRRNDIDPFEAGPSPNPIREWWADRRHFVVPGSDTYQRVSIYTRAEV